MNMPLNIIIGKVKKEKQINHIEIKFQNMLLASDFLKK